MGAAFPAGAGRLSGRTQSLLLLAFHGLGVVCAAKPLNGAELVFDGPTEVSVAPAVNATAPVAELRAGVAHSGVSLRNVTHDTLPTGEGQCIRFVRGDVESFEQCGDDWVLGPDVLGGNGRDNFTGPGCSASLDVNASLNWTNGTASAPIVLLKGTTFRVCYSDGGDWRLTPPGNLEPNYTQLLDSPINVLGLTDSCVGAGCFAARRVECHASREEPAFWGESSCSLLSTAVFGEGRNASVTPAFSATFNASTGTELTVSTFTCGEALRYGDENGTLESGESHWAVNRTDGRGYEIDFTNIRAELSVPATFAVCYCPAPLVSGTDCSDFSGYTQQVGLLMLFTAAMCGPQDYVACGKQYHRVAAGQRFAVRVFCPPGGCPGSAASRINVVESDASALLPNWHPDNGCRSAQQSDNWLPRSACSDLQSCLVDGGGRQDHRTWGAPPEWWSWDPKANPGAERPDFRTFAGAAADVCFCAEGCDNARSAVWFKAGELYVAPTQISVVEDALAVVGVKGNLGLARSAVNAKALGLEDGGVVKLVPDPDRSVSADDCDAAAFGAFPAQGLATAVDAVDRAGTPLAGGGLIFQGVTISNTISSLGFQPDASGVVAVCYCAEFSLSGGACLSGGFFVAARLAIQGPVPGQYWTVSTEGLFSLEYYGHHFDGEATLRLSEAPCADASGSPVASDLVAYGCPSACVLASSVDARDINTTMLTDSTVGCDDEGNGCTSAPIIGVATDADGTELSFERDPGLESGDEVTIESGVSGGTAGQLESLKGVFGMVDGAGNPTNVLRRFAHPVSSSSTLSPLDRRLRGLAFGLSGEAMPTFSVDAGGASWVRRSRASTRQELLAPVGPTGPLLHVCWRAGEKLGANAVGDGYTAQVGTISFEEAPAMPKAAMVLVAPLLDRTVPAIIAFQTGTVAYPVHAPATALVLRFATSNSVAPRTSGGGVPVGVSKNLGTQSSCADGVFEVWSSRQPDGFPLPRRCSFRPSYKRPGGDDVMEFAMEFEAYNGLAANTQYQIVMNVHVADAFLPGEAVSIEASGDLRLSLNSVTEVGRAGLLGAGGATILTEPSSPLLSKVSLLGSALAGSELVDVGTPIVSISLQLEASPGLGTIGKKLRIVLWPVTQWQLQGQRLSGFENGRPSSFTLTAEALESNVRGSLNSFVLDGLGLQSSSAGLVTIDAENDMLGGFFSARPSVVVSSDSTWASPCQYLDAVGPLSLHRAAYPAAMLVTAHGDGDHTPFAGDSNELYVRLLLPSGLPSSATLTLESPAFMTACAEADTLPEVTLLNVSAPPPYGSGSIRQGTWSVGSVAKLSGFLKCSWSLNGAALLPGTSAYVELSLSNPAEPVRRGAPVNKWHVLVDDSSLAESWEVPFEVPSVLAAQGSANIPSYDVSVAAVGEMPFAQILPSSMVLGTTQTLYVLFEALQIVYPSGAVEVEAPWNFDFGPTPCSPSDLPTELYVDGGGAITAVLWRIPRVTGCETSRWPIGASVFTRARMALERGLLVGRRYAFGLEIRNPDAFLPRDSLLWAIRTFDSDGSAVDRSRTPISVDGSPGQNLTMCWGLYDAELAVVPSLRWAGLNPYELMLVTGMVTVIPIVMPRDTNVPLRMVAPLGFMWEEPGQFWQSKPVGAEGVFAYAPRVLSDTVIQWDRPVFLQGGVEYGFRMAIRVPTWPKSLNTFYLEFGYRTASPYSAAENVGRFPFFVPLQGPSTISIVRAPEVDYLSGRFGLQHQVIIRLTTVTTLFPGDSFVFKGGPATASIQCRCPHPSVLLERSLSCSITRLEGSFQRDQLLFVMGVEEMMLPSEHAFAFECRNYDTFTEAGTWIVGSYLKPSTYPQLIPSDGQAVVPGFAIRPPMKFFAVLQASVLSGQDPRPLRQSESVINFHLSESDWTAPSTARIRAPEGSVFPVDCLDNVITQPGSIFNVARGEIAIPNCVPLPAPRWCHGTREKMLLTFESLIPRETNLCVRVKVRNPPFMPDQNFWAMEVDNQSSVPSAGPVIQAFRGVSLAYATRAARYPSGRAVVGDDSCNRIRFNFQPSATIYGKAFRIVAPEGYSFGQSTDCGSLTLVSRIDMGDADAIVSVPRLSACSFAGRQADLTFQPPGNMTPQATYVLEVDALNPVAPTDSGELFTISSVTVIGTIGDEMTIAPQPFYTAATLFELERLNGGYDSLTSATALLKAQFPKAIGKADRLEVVMPPGFQFNGTCPVVWVTPKDGPRAECECTDDDEICKVVIVAPPFNTSWASGWEAEHFAAPWPANRIVSIQIGVINPPTPASMFRNYWEFALFNPISAANWNVPLALGARRGWTVRAKLRGVSVALQGGPDSIRRASALGGVLLLDLVPSERAFVLTLDGSKPSGWSFLESVMCGYGGGAETCRAADTKPDTPELFEMSVGLAAGLRFRREIRNVRNADIGGQTVFEIITYTFDVSGRRSLVDETSQFESFVLPGLLNDSRHILRTEDYFLKFPNDAVLSELPPRAGVAEAMYFWRFSTTRPAFRGDWIEIEAPNELFELTISHASVYEADIVPGMPPVPTTVEMAGDRVRVNLWGPLDVWPQEYEAKVTMTVTEDLPTCTRFLRVDLMRTGEPLPVATNDGMADPGELDADRCSTSFDFEAFTVVSPGAAPLAQVSVVGLLPPKRPDWQSATSMFLLAPVGISIVEPCSPTPCESIIEDYEGTGRVAMEFRFMSFFAVRVQLPRLWVENENYWVVLLPTPNETMNETFAWNSTPGFELQQMQSTVFYSANANSVTSPLLLTFAPGVEAAAMVTNVKIDAEGNSFGGFFRAELQAPQGYTFRCDDLFEAIIIPFPAEANCTRGENSRTAVFMIELNGVNLTRIVSDSGWEFVFRMSVSVPAETPDPNFFELLVQDHRKITIDANTNIPGEPVQTTRLRIRVVWAISDFENMHWLSAWVDACRERGVIFSALSVALQVDASHLFVESVALIPGAASSQALLNVNVSAAVELDEENPGSEANLKNRLGQEELFNDLVSVLLGKAESVDLVPVNIMTIIAAQWGVNQPPNATHPDLHWEGRPGGLSTIWVQMRWFFENEEPCYAVRAMLVILPAGFEHMIERLDDLGATSNFPLAQGNYLRTRAPGVLQIFLDETKPLTRGGYRLTFDVLVPEIVPPRNVWQLCMCASRECDSPTHESVLLTLAFWGFRHGQPRITARARHGTEHGLLLVVAAFAVGWHVW